MDEKELTLEQYRIFVETADRVSERRSQANNFFVSINTALIAAIPIVFEKIPTSDEAFFAKAIGIAGILLNVIWFLTIRTYKNLNSAKFVAIHEIEGKLPHQPFRKEWQELKKKKWLRKYLTLSGVEVFLPFAFAFIFWAIISRYTPMSSLTSIFHKFCSQ